MSKAGIYNMDLLYIIIEFKRSFTKLFIIIINII